MSENTTLYILYGSATGNAEQIAKDLAQQPLPPNGFRSVVCEPLEKYKKYLDGWMKPNNTTPSKKHGLILISSTTGNGDAPENASRFIRYIKRKSTVEKMPFQHSNYAVLGLGDTNYDQFCAAGKVIDKKLNDLGGTRVKPLAMADEATGLEDVVDPWTSSILQDMTDACFGTNNSGDGTTTKDDGKSTAENESTRTSVETTPVTPITDAPVHATIIPPQSSAPLFILYGSVTGNAEQIAKDLAATYESLLGNPDAKCFFPSVVCCELDQWKKKCVSEWETQPPHPTKHGLIIVTSTTGNGDPPENASRFVRYLKRKSTIQTTPFQHVAYCVLGLGDTNYDKFGETGRVIDSKLHELGGTRAKPFIVADEATGLEDVVEPWKQSVLLDISNACRGVGMPSSTTETAAKRTSTAAPQNADDAADEEKKMDLIDTTLPSTSTSTATSAPASSGVSTVRSLLQIPSSSPLPSVEHKCLPPLGTSRSSCELFHGDEELRRRSRGMSLAEIDRMTISSSSTTAIHYTMARPFHAKILNARYLTATSTEAAKAISDLLGDLVLDDELLMQTMDVYEQHFPLELSETSSDADVCERNGKRVIEMALALPDDFTLEYQPGDSLGIVVQNTPQAVQFILNMLEEKQQVPRTQKVSIDSDHPITVEEAARTRVDLCSPVKSKRILHSLSQFAADPQEESALRLLASKTPEGEALFCKFVDEQCMTFVDVLKEFPSCQAIPLEALFGILPGIPPRYYSVSSSPLDPRHGTLCLTVTFSVVDYMTPSLTVQGGQDVGHRRIGGLATRYLEVLCAPFLCRPDDQGTPNVSSPATLPIFPKPTKEFQLPDSLAAPIILIGPGTGVAPFMGFLRHRQAQAQRSKKVASTILEGTWRGDYELKENELTSDAMSGGHSYQQLGKAKLFFGCRYADHDWLYKEEMMELERQGKIELHTAFSRQPPPKQYVQDRMRQDKEALAKWIVQDKAYVYVCGDGNHMAKDVQEAMVEILSGHVDDPKAYLEKLKEQNKFVMDIWTS